MSSASNSDTRRQNESGKLNIDRRKALAARRDDDRRVWLDKAYENIYIPSYVNEFHPYFEAKIHAFSNLFDEPAQAEWVAHEMAQTDARQSKCPRTIKDFAVEMIRRGLVVDESGTELTPANSRQLHTEMLLLKTGT